MPAKDGGKSWAKRNPSRVLAYKRDYVKRNVVKVRAERKTRLAQKREWIAAYKETRGCDDENGKKYPSYVLDFDHRPSAKKLGNICKMALSGWLMLKAEVDKCDVVCANCHRIRTVRRLREAGGSQAALTAASVQLKQGID